MNEVKPDGAACAGWQGAESRAETLGLKTSDLRDQMLTGSRRQPDRACLLQPPASAKARTRVKTLLSGGSELTVKLRAALGPPSYHTGFQQTRSRFLGFTARENRVAPGRMGVHALQEAGASHLNPISAVHLCPWNVSQVTNRHFPSSQGPSVWGVLRQPQGGANLGELHSVTPAFPTVPQSGLPQTDTGPFSEPRWLGGVI